GRRARYRAAGSGAEVGGDWYDVFSLPNGDVAFVIGDVVGHDIDAAAVMSQLRTLVRGAGWLSVSEPAAIVTNAERVNEGIGLDALATLVVVTARRAGDGWDLAWANAGHHPPLVISSDGQTRT